MAFGSTVADDGRHLADGRGDLAERILHVADEVALEEEVARRVAGRDELGKDDDLGPLGDQRLVGVEDLPAIAGQVADGGVELGEAEAHGEREGTRLAGPGRFVTPAGADFSGWRARQVPGSLSLPLIPASPLILASASPRRRELLAQLGVPFTVVTAAVTEFEDPAADPQVLVAHNAALKADWVAERHPRAIVLGADTTVFLDGAVLNKPADLAEARAMLQRLSGRTHTVFTGLAVRRREDGLRLEAGATSEVTFLPLDEAIIEGYLARVHTLDKAGGYSIQDRGDLVVAGYRGSYSNIMGLPLETTKQILTRCGLLG